MTTGKIAPENALLLALTCWIFFMTCGLCVESCAEASRYEHCVKYHPPKECK